MSIEFETRGLPKFVPLQQMLDAVAAEREACAKFIESRRYVSLEPGRTLTGAQVKTAMEETAKCQAGEIRRRGKA